MGCLPGMVSHFIKNAFLNMPLAIKKALSHVSLSCRIRNQSNNLTETLIMWRGFIGNCGLYDPCSLVIII